jgi:hypothetical protein
MLSFPVCDTFRGRYQSITHNAETIRDIRIPQWNSQTKSGSIPGMATSLSVWKSPPTDDTAETALDHHTAVEKTDVNKKLQRKARNCAWSYDWWRTSSSCDIRNKNWSKPFFHSSICDEFRFAIHYPASTVCMNSKNRYNIYRFKQCRRLCDWHSSPFWHRMTSQQQNMEREWIYFSSRQLYSLDDRTFTIFCISVIIISVIDTSGSWTRWRRC